MRRKLTIAGSLAQRPGNGGHTWVFLQYLLGFRRLGFDVLFLDRIEPGMCADRAGQSTDFDHSFNRAYFTDVMRKFDLEHAYALFVDGGKQGVGRGRAEVLRHVAGSEFLLNVMGFFDVPDVLDHAQQKIFLDIDPGFGQMWKALGLSDIFAGHDRHVTIGENIGRPDCEIPTCGLDWITTPQPVVLDQWPVAPTNEGAFTGIVTWRGPFGPIEFNGKTYGLRAHEFRRFADLPSRTNQTFELALDIHPADQNDITLLTENGWRLRDPKTVAADTDSYRRYIQQSRAELMIAKNMYVATRGGWVSDRSLCYLASGKPVLAQDTGLTGRYPTTEGFVTFSTADEAAAGVESIVRDYSRHAAAARRIAAEHFDSDKVLARLIQKFGVSAS
jgi:hypothetical protein